MLLLRSFLSCSTSLPSAVLPRSTLLGRTVVLLCSCWLFIGKNTFLVPHWRWVRCSPEFFQKRKKCMGRGVPECFGDNDKLVFCSFKLSVGLRLKNTLRVFASSPADLTHGCAELLINILYVIYIGIIIYIAQASLMSSVSETIKCWAGLNVAINKVDKLEVFLLASLCRYPTVCYNCFLWDLFWAQRLVYLCLLLFPCGDPHTVTACSDIL